MHNDTQWAGEIAMALQEDPKFGFKKKGGYLRGTCPACGKKELFVKISKPWRIKCGRENNCGRSWTARELLPHLFKNYEERFPPTPENPKATADAYLMHDRGFKMARCRDWYTQEWYKLPDTGETVPTIRFYLDPEKTRYWERLIGKTKSDGQKANNGGRRRADGYLFKGDAWTPPCQELKKGDDCYITEGIFHAIALDHAGKKVAAALSSSNFPNHLIEANKGKEITWVLALDGDSAGRKAMTSHRLKIKEMGEAVEVCLLKDGKNDWDDLWQAKKLDDAFIEECIYRGSLFTAGNLVEKAWRIFCRNPTQRHLTVDYNNALWSVEVDSKFAAELHEEKIILTTPEGFEKFNIACTVDHISSVIPTFLYIERDEIVGDQKYIFQIDYESGSKTDVIGFEGTALSNAKSFHNALLANSSCGTYHGSDRAFKFMMTKKWFKTKPLKVHSVPYVGYEKTSGAWVFHQHAFLDGKKITKNKHGYFNLGKCGVKANMSTFDINTDGNFNPEWLPNYIKAFNYQGLAVLVFWLGSLFVQQIRKKQSSFPFLEFTGDAGAGKTTVIEFCWKLVGLEEHEGLNIINASKSGKRRAFSQISNLPLVIIESDQGGNTAGRTSQFNYESLKDLFNGRPPGVIGVATRDNATKAQNFLGSLMFSQNETVQGSEAILSRIVHCHADKKHHSPESRKTARWFEQQLPEDVSGFLEVALKNEKRILETFFSMFRPMENFFENQGVRHQRIIKCHAQLAAVAHSLKFIFPNFTKDMLNTFLDYLVNRALEREERIRADHPLVEKFWETFSYINSQMQDGKGMDISPDDSQIAVNLNEFRARCLEYGQELIESTELKRYLESSKRHKFICKNKSIRDKRQNKTTKCWVFTK